MVDRAAPSRDPGIMQRCWGLLGIVLAGCNSSGVDLDASAAGGDGPRGDGTAIDAPTTMIDAPIPGGVGEPDELAGITLYHNQVRAMVQTATPLPSLTWSSSLAATAAAWVAQCQNTDGFPSIMDHNAGRSTGHPYYVGENIFAAGGAATAQGAVNLWAAEKPNYNPMTGACNGTCGHYTQVVWRTTLEVGCALGNCPSIQFPNTIVCNYGPGGNNGGLAY
jgi:pathogenesis-related protein 1